MLHFTSDHHFGHTNIMKFQENRSFKDVNEMNEFLIDKWNSKVGKKDDVYYLGDFCFGNFEEFEKIIKQLNGRIHFIKGNHDPHGILNKLEKYIVWWKYYYELKIKDADWDSDKVMICLFHFPIEEWNKYHKGSLMFHGHQHYNPDAKKENRLDVGVDNPACDFAPFSYDDIKSMLINK